MRKRPSSEDFDRDGGKRSQRLVDPLENIPQPAQTRRPVQEHPMVAAFRDVLTRQLTFNSKPVIDQLTMMATQAAKDHALSRSITDTCLRHLHSCSLQVKVPVLFAIDSIIKNVGEPYRTGLLATSPSLVDVFVESVRRIPGGDQMLADFARVLLTWRGLLPPAAVSTMESSLRAPAEALAAKPRSAVSQPAAAMPPLPPTSQLLEILSETLRRIAKDPGREYTQHQSFRLRNLMAHIRMKADVPADLVDRIEELLREERFTQAYDQAVAASLSLVLSTDVLSSLAGMNSPDDTPMPDHYQLFSYKHLLSAKLNVPAMLYGKSQQCKNCALRFADDSAGRDSLAKHLDAHFKRNIRLKELTTPSTGKATVQVRGWFLPAPEWTSYGSSSAVQDDAAKESAVMASIASIFESKTSKREEPPMEVLNLPVPPNEDQHDRTCPACLEPIRVFWDDDRDGWFWRDAIESAGEVYHSACGPNHD